jgi:hypothetical protein
MRDRLFILGAALVGITALAPLSGFAQVQAGQNRIPQQIVINGQMASGVYVTLPGGQTQSYTCPAPQHYSTADGTSQGWACYEQTTGVWLLNAVPPAQAQAPQVAPAPMPAPAPAPPVIVQAAPQPPVVIYQQPPPTVVYQTAPVVYQPAPTVVYQQPPTVIYSQPAPTTVVYAPAPRPVIVEPAYPSSVILGTAAINAAGRIASAAIANSHHREYYTYNYYDNNRDRHHDRDHGRRW